MAYVSQDKKKEIAEILKFIMPKNWKYTLSVHNKSCIVLTIKSADVDIMGEYNTKKNSQLNYVDLNEYHLKSYFNGDTLEKLEEILMALNHGNHNNSDSMTDYYDVGHYVSIKIGRYDKPFEYRPVEPKKLKTPKV